MAMEQTPEMLALAVTQGRAEAGYPTIKALAERTGLSTRTIGAIESGSKTSYSAATLWALDDAFNWRRGNAHDLLHGGTKVIQLTNRTPEEDLADRKSELIEVLEVSPVWLEGLDEANISEVEMAAKLAASEKARELQAQRRNTLGERAVETVRHSVDTTTPTRASITQESR